MSATKKLMAMGGIFLFLLFILSFPLYAQQNPPILDNVLTLVLTFGAEGLPDEYLIVGRRQSGSLSGASGPLVAVDDNNNIYVLDEYKVKVYNQNGKPKAIFGGKGQGPGEFADLPTGPERITVSPTGFITVYNEPWFGYNVYNPQYKFVKIIFKDYYQDTKTGFQSRHINLAFTINENEYTGVCMIDSIKNYLNYTTFNLEYWKNNKKNIIASYTYPTKITNIRSYVEISKSLGRFFYSMFQNNNIMYTHSSIDENLTNNSAFYLLNIYNLDTGTKKQYKFPFTPIELSSDEQLLMGNRGGYQDDMKLLQELKEKYLKEKGPKTRPAINNILFDNKFAYVILYNQKEEKKGNKTYLLLLYNIVDLETGNLINSFYTSSFNQFLAIKNGYAYKSVKNKDGYPVIEKYKIDPKVYGK